MPREQLIAALERLLDAHRTPKRTLKTAKDQAEFLNLSAPHYSRIRTGAVPLSSYAFDTMARRLARSPEEIEAVREQLRPFLGTDTAPETVARLAAIALRNAAPERLPQVIKEITLVYAECGYPYERFEVVLSALRLARPATVDTSGLI